MNIYKFKLCLFSDNLKMKDRENIYLILSVIFMILFTILIYWLFIEIIISFLERPKNISLIT